jgi:hypothetical protein
LYYVVLNDDFIFLVNHDWLCFAVQHKQYRRRRFPHAVAGAHRETVLVVHATTATQSECATHHGLRAENVPADGA